MNKQIFIGGTGRSGTTFLSRLLGSHKDIAKMPVETRFLIDKNGMIDLVPSLTTNYSIDQSRIAILQIKKLLETDLTNNHSLPYDDQNFYKYFGEDYYKDLVKQFLLQIIDVEFKGRDYHTEKDLLKIEVLFKKYYVYTIRLINIITKSNYSHKYDFKSGLEKMYIGKYFKDSSKLEDSIFNFTNKLFLKYAESKGKSGWCEDTPANILHIEFLSKTFPNAYFIHMVRNPIGVAYSMKNKIWAPSDYKSIVPYLSNIYERIISSKEFLKTGNVKYLEVRLEDFSIDFNKHIGDINEFLEIADEYDGSVQIKSSKVNYYKDLIPKKEYNFLNEKLSKYIEYFGY